ncbi:hypothetical protein ANOM_002423 [Aspergillus nomiae NRRL 13137]|uniref:Uncharacterized protein n=1 Tax=Aspergillus nomiae NRRL (strain ATCC 15546 / NRRL 13137 / CBS 260.88 / M93) TaxID=1509407 RepID=A0A0L1JB73_ASPN3|nr:uncharacterized protein ANOM_002423 [Aspergillus nomiae NRRL 13137]KNG88999.1 hypothetical protein ANOM_002423 [Aspergillus nomiae NRRL 13137]
MASQQGLTDTVKLLIKHSSLATDRADFEGRTPLSHAADEGHYEVMQLLLTQEDIDVDSRDTDGRRRRKVRCIFTPGNSEGCVHCVRRRTICVPQGSDESEHSHDSNQTSLGIPRGDPMTVRNLPNVQSDAPFHVLEALAQLKEIVRIFLKGDPQHAMGAAANSATANSDTVQSGCAPIMKLLNHELKNVLMFYTDFVWRCHPSQRWSRSFALEVIGDKHGVNPLHWAGGEESDSDLQSFAMRAFRTGHPCLLAILLLCFAFSTGDFGKYLCPVEQLILHDDDLAGGRYGLQCLMALGLCYMSSLQPRRAWIAYRRANTLSQLAGIHQTHRNSELLDSLFWQLFSADRWVSLMIGLPHSVPKNLCDLYIPTLEESTPIKFHARHLSVLTGRVIDCLQINKEPTLSAVIRTDEQIDEVTSQLPAGYLDMEQISLCEDISEKHARLYRLANIHQLKAHLYLPFFLQSSARIDNSVKLSGFSALTAAVIVFLHLLGRDTSWGTTSKLDSKWYDQSLISRTRSALKDCSEDQPSSLSGQCHAALEELVTSCQSLAKGTSRQIAVPYFGIVTVHRKCDDGVERDDGSWQDIPAGLDEFGPGTTGAGQYTVPVSFDDLCSHMLVQGWFPIRFIQA